MDKYQAVSLYNAGIMPMNDLDINNADFVEGMLPDKSFSLTYPERHQSLDKDIRIAVNSFNIYKDIIIKETIEKIALETPNVPSYKHPHQFGCTIGQNTYMVYVYQFKIPEILDREAPIILGHEYHHALKDTNPDEAMLQMCYADLIPIFYELVMAETRNGEAKTDLLKARINLLNFNKGRYKLYKGMPGDLINDYNISINGEYLNSYYYALALFRLYKEKPNLIMGLVGKVLRHEMTTLELLLVLDLYNVNLDHEVQDEFNEIKKAL